MRKSLTRLFTTIAVLAAIGQLHGAQYFVDGKAAAANDSGPGTKAKPFKTISAGVAKLKSGDTLTISAGVYREGVKVKARGTANAPITIQSAPDEHVIITGADLLKGWKKFPNKKNRPIWVLKPFAEWNKFRYDPHKGHGRDYGPQLMVDSRMINEAPTLKNLTVASFFYDRAEKAIYLWTPPARTRALVTAKGAQFWDTPVNLASEDPNDHQIEASVRHYCFSAAGTSHLTVRGLHVRYTVGRAQQGAFEVNGDNLLVENCVVEFSHGRGLSCTGKNITIRNCLIRYNGASGAGGCLKDSLWENNSLIGNTTLGHSHGWEAGGVKFVRSNRLTIRGCRFIDNDGPGLWFDWNNSEITIERNFCSGNRGSGIMMEFSPAFAAPGPDAKAVVETDEDIKKGRVRDLREPAPSIIRNNIVVNQRHDGTWGHGILLQLASKTHVLNNTVFGTAAYGIFLRYHPYGHTPHRIVDNVIMNNIVADNGGCQIYITPDPKDKPGSVARNVSDYNLFFDSANWAKSKARGKLPWSFETETWSRWGKTQFAGTFSREEWTKIYGYDEHSLQRDPRFVSAGALDFRLLPDSPAIGAGKPTKFVTDDFYGRKRPTNRPPTIGAIEFYPHLPPSVSRN